MTLHYQTKLFFSNLQIICYCFVSHSHANMFVKQNNERTWNDNVRKIEYNLVIKTHILYEDISCSCINLYARDNKKVKTIIQWLHVVTIVVFEQNLIRLSQSEVQMSNYLFVLVWSYGFVFMLFNKRLVCCQKSLWICWDGHVNNQMLLQGH